MARHSIQARIAQLDAHKQALQARLSKQERAIDTRRKVLLGAMLLHAVERGRAGQGSPNERDVTATLDAFVVRELPGFLTRPIDSTLFPDFIEPAAVPDTGAQISTEIGQ